jgi:hypothetical protein
VIEAARLRERATSGRVAATLTSIWVLGPVIGLLSWRGGSSVLAPGAGLDSSWHLGVDEAISTGLDFGSDVVFTYGPLGFLELPLATDQALLRLSVLYNLALWVALGISVLYAARRSFPLAIALPVALGVCLLIGYPPIPLAVLWALIAVSPDGPAQARRALPFAAGFLGAVTLLTKLDTGIVVLAVGVVAAALCEPRRWARGLLEFGATLLVSLLVLWLVTGQSVGDLPSFIDNGLAVASGYSTNFSVEVVEDPWRYELGAAALIAIALGAAFVAGRGMATPRRVALLLIVVLAGFFAWKAAFVRHDLIRATAVTAFAFAVLLAFRWRGRERLLALAALAATAVAYFPLTGLRVGDAIRPLDNVDNASAAIRAAFDPDERERILADSRSALQAFYGLDERSRELLEGRSVYVYPFEITLVWAYGLDWSPLPVLQPYLAYTPELDRLNAERLTAPDGPERILTHATPLSYGIGSDYYGALDPSQRGELETSNDVSVDGRYLSYEQPETTLAMLCNFVPLRTTLSYQVLGRMSDRCGEPRPLGSVEAENEEAVGIPAPPRQGDLVLARVEGLQPEGLERLGTLLYRATTRRVEFDSGEGGRLAADIASSGLIVRAPKNGDFPEPFRFAPRARTVSFSEDPGFLSSADPIEIQFFAISLEPLPGRGAMSE